MTRRNHKTPRPREATWRTARLYQADLYNVRYPVCGTHLIWAVVGHKHVRCVKPITNQKWRMKRRDWDATPTIEKETKR